MEHRLAQVIMLPGNNVITGPLGGEVGANPTLGSIVSAAMKYVFWAGGIGALIMIVMAGLSLLTSAGDAKKAEGAKHQLTNAITGLIIIIAAYWIVQMVGYMLSIQSITQVFH